MKFVTTRAKQRRGEILGQERHSDRTAKQRQVFEKEKGDVIAMAGQIFMRVDEVASELGVSKPYAYKLIKQLNDELKETGCITIPGRIDRKFFYEKFYGTRERKEH